MLVYTDYIVICNFCTYNIAGSTSKGVKSGEKGKPERVKQLLISCTTIKVITASNFQVIENWWKISYNKLANILKCNLIDLYICLYVCM